MLDSGSMLILSWLVKKKQGWKIIRGKEGIFSRNRTKTLRISKMKELTILQNTSQKQYKEMIISTRQMETNTGKKEKKEGGKMHLKSSRTIANLFIEMIFHDIIE
jgi:hypothetical protein